MSIDPIRGGVPPIQSATTGARPSPEPARKAETTPSDDVIISKEAITLSEAAIKAKEIRQTLEQDKNLTLSRPGSLDDAA